MANTAAVKKIAICGLANAGKTTLIRTLQHKYHIGESLTPTRGVERNQITLFGQAASIWDFGGQVQYQKQYLANPDRYFSDLGFLFYVIDIQDSAHFADSLEYFEKIYHHAQSLNNELIIVVLLHKNDPPIADQPTTLKTIDSLKKEVKNLIQDSEYAFFNTTVYDPLSILDAFSRPIIGDKPIYNAISVLLANFSLAHSIEYMNLMIDDLFEVGSFRLRTSKTNFMEASLKFYQQFASLEMDQKLRKYEFEGYLFMIVKGRIGNYNYALNLAHKSTNVNDVPRESEIAKMLSNIEEAFRKYQPTFN
jgi:small GTP-binding protein